jgi:glycosyltransferase involved in cell wall biosynthesis
LHSAYSTRRDINHPCTGLERRALADLPLVACSQNMIDDVCRYIGSDALPAGKEIDLILDGVDDLPLWGRERRLEEWIVRHAGGKKIFLLIGRFIPLKRLPDYMTACRILMDLGDPLFMILVAYGKADAMRDMRRRFRVMFSPGEAELLCHVANPVDLMSHVHAGISCSSLEGLPVTLLEYMANDTPVVCSDIPAHRQIVEHEKTGLMFPVGDLPGMVKQMRRILYDDELRAAVARDAGELVAPRKWKAAAEQTLEIYHKILRDENRVNRT